MRFWIREIAGWLLVLAGLLVFYICLGMVQPPQSPRVFSAVPVMIIGIIIFRGGIHLLKVAVAARICARMAPLPIANDNGFARNSPPVSQPATRLLQMASDAHAD